MIDTLPSDRTNQPFRISVLPRRSGRGRSISDAHGANTPKEYLAIGPIAVTHQVFWTRLPSAGFSELPCNPFRGRIPCSPQPQNLASVMPQYEQTVQKPE